jgi:catechol 2,3-dioxygenase-like lactoylglutathione lyase family enzyme
MRINLTSVLVDDQENAVRFYTDVLGFEKKTARNARVGAGPGRRPRLVVGAWA